MTTPAEAANLILKWAENRTEPFMTSDAHKEIQEIENVKDVSDGLRYLFTKNLVTRQQVAGGKFIYSMAANPVRVEKPDVAIVEEKQEIIKDEDEMRANKVEETADQIQVGGDHYKSQEIQPWHAMEAWMSPDQFKGFLRGNVIKYIARCDKKGGAEDLKKARHYLDKLIEVCEK